jgi:YHS domain-containing protein
MTLLLLTLIIFQSTENHDNLDRSGLALDGYDPVSYFQGKPVNGKSEFSYSHKGSKYFFASRSNLDQFKRTPESFTPAYGGWCAYAMGATGDKVKIDPETYKIVDDRLFLFYNFWGNNTLEDWNKDEKALQTNADLQWDRIIKSIR